MKMSLCKVHLGMFQYRLAVPQLRVGGLVRAAALGAPGRGGTRPHPAPAAARCPWLSASRPSEHPPPGCSAASASGCVKQNEQGALRPGLGSKLGSGHGGSARGWAPRRTLEADPPRVERSSLSAMPSTGASSEEGAARAPMTLPLRRRGVGLGRARRGVRPPTRTLGPAAPAPGC